MKKLNKKEVKEIKQEEKDLTTLKIIREKIKEGNTYKYKDLCEIFNEAPAVGNSKIRQLKDWQRFINWIKPTIQQYLITEIYYIPNKKTDGRKTNGNKNFGKGKLNTEFDYIFDYFMAHEYTANEYRLNKPKWEETYFTKKRISIFFGLYNKNFGKARYDEYINYNIYLDIANKIREKQRSWIFDKIKRKENNSDKIKLTYGIMAYKHKGDKQPDYKDELLEEYNKYKQEYMDNNNFKLDEDIINAGKWNEMTDNISSHIDGYEQVIKCHKLEFKKEDIEYDYNLVKEYKKHFNDTIIKDIYDYFLNKIKNNPETNEDYQIELMRAAQEDCSVNYVFNKEKEKFLMQPYVYILDTYVRI